ncbi:MAG: hypothetical protein BMS9Abin25_1551 [Gammaproteobacteria bacterium]|nr:MAG: hypothetical protein BMS9Abin25_1551 [Gammaproteobacteria bacterium]
MNDMKNKTFQPALFLYLLVVAISTMADSSDTDTKLPAEAAEPAKEKAAEEVKKKYEPATRFTPTEKLRADETVAFPVDI